MLVTSDERRWRQRAAMLVLVAVLAAQVPWAPTDVPVGQAAAEVPVPNPEPEPVVLDGGLADTLLRFEQNRGQEEATVKFVARSPTEAHFLTPTEAVTTWLVNATTPGPPPETENGTVWTKTRDPAATRFAVLRMAFAGANPTPTMTGEDVLAAPTHYLEGEAANWETSVASFARVRYHDLWPGVDAVFRSTLEGALKTDYELDAGIDPGVPRFAFTGADSLEVNATGDLLVHTGNGVVVHEAPIAYQDQPEGRVFVTASYLVDGLTFRFNVSGHDPARPLVIDPVFITKGKYHGGSGLDLGYAVASDQAGDVYTVGYTTSSNFPTVQPYDNTYGGNTDAFLTKWRHAPTGLERTFSTYLGGSGEDIAYDVALDPNGTIVVVGRTDSTNFPIVNPPLGMATLSGADDAFVTKVAADGASLIHSAYLGGTSDDNAYAVAIDPLTGTIAVAGDTDSTNYPTKNEYQTDQTSRDATLTFLSRIGDEILASTYLGAASGESAYALAYDGAGQATVAGHTNSAAFPTKNPVQPNRASSGAGYDAFVTRFRPLNPDVPLSLGVEHVPRRGQRRRRRSARPGRLRPGRRHGQHQQHPLPHHHQRPENHEVRRVGHVPD